MVPIRWSLLGRRVVLMVISIAVIAGCSTDRRTPAAGIDPLPAWNDGASKAAIVDFVTAMTTPSSPDFVAVPERIAVFDNDGTLWSEQPVYFQFQFALDRIRAR